MERKTAEKNKRLEMHKDSQTTGRNDCGAIKNPGNTEMGVRNGEEHGK